MDDQKGRAAVLITLALVGLFINIVMFSAGIGSAVVVLITIALAVWGGITLKNAS